MVQENIRTSVSAR